MIISLPNLPKPSTTIIALASYRTKHNRFENSNDCSGPACTLSVSADCADFADVFSCFLIGVIRVICGFKTPERPTSHVGATFAKEKSNKTLDRPERRAYYAPVE